MQAPLQATNDSDAGQKDTAKTVAQKRVLAGNRPETVARCKLAEIMNNSPRVLQQRALCEAIHNSPRTVAQRHEMNALFDGAVKPQADGAMAAEASPAQRQEKTNHTGLPDQLKSGIEALSGMSMDHVKVHYNSDKPAQLQAHAYAEGSEIHIAPGREVHLPHEAWHVVQQAQGRVKPTMRIMETAVNDDARLEAEADTMGSRAVQRYSAVNMNEPSQSEVSRPYRSSVPLKSTQLETVSPSCNGPIAQLVDKATPEDLFDIIDNKLQDVKTEGIELKRLLYWNAQGLFKGDGRTGLNFTKRLKKAQSKKIPGEENPVAEDFLPEWMRIRKGFRIQLPSHFGSGTLFFARKPQNIVFERRGWISDNVYWRGPPTQEGKRIRYMIHAIVEWKGQDFSIAPTPHITLRNAKTQANIDLDIYHPLGKVAGKVPSRTLDNEATKTSFSQGLNVDRSKGELMDNDASTFDYLPSKGIQNWLTELSKEAKQEPPQQVP